MPANFSSFPGPLYLSCRCKKDLTCSLWQSSCCSENPPGYLSLPPHRSNLLSSLRLEVMVKVVKVNFKRISNYLTGFSSISTDKDRNVYLARETMINPSAGPAGFNWGITRRTGKECGAIITGPGRPKMGRKKWATQNWAEKAENQPNTSDRRR